MTKTFPYGPDGLPPPPGYEPPPPPKSASKKPVIIAIAAVAGVVVIGAGLALLLKGGQTAPVETVAGDDGAVIKGEAVTTPLPDYGASVVGIPGLQGRFYDHQKNPSGGNSDWPRNLAGGEAFSTAFLKGELTDEVLAKNFWTAPTPLRTGRFAFSARPPAEVHDFFGVTAKAHLYYWAVVYRGKVKAPFTGDFRFVGFGSDAIAVRFNGAPVLESHHARFAVGVASPYEELYRFGTPKKDGTYVGDPVRAGAWIAVEKGKVYDIEIAMIHAQPYSLSKFFLMFERRGENHPAGEKGYRTYTRFRVTEDPGPPTPEDPEMMPPAENGPVFPVVL